LNGGGNGIEREGTMRTIRWLFVASGLGVIYYVARAVVVYLLGVLAFFITAFQAAVQEIAEVAPAVIDLSDEKESSRSLPPRLAADRAYRDSAEAQRVIDVREEVSLNS
jgi:hypothetical protein